MPAKFLLRIPRPTTGFSAGHTVEFALILTLIAALVIGGAAAFSASTNRRLIGVAAAVRGDSPIPKSGARMLKGPPRMLKGPH